jgi:tetratricopeptide (TPR) repeat protein
LIAYRRAIEVDPRNHRNHQNLGAYFFRRANYAEAATHFKRAVGLAPDEPHPRFALAVAYQNLGQFGDAELELRRSVSLRETWDALQTLGQVLMYENRDLEAVTYLRRALDVDPRHSLVWLHLGIAYRRTGQVAQEQRANRRALETAEAEIARNPRSGDVRSQVAYLCARLGNGRRAESEAAQALQMAPDDSNTRWMAVMTYEALGRRDSALTVLKGAPAELLADLNRWPDAADLRRDPRFLKLLVRNKTGN